MEMKSKTFAELTTKELYEILRLRSEVFIVEQGGCYQDLDGIDLASTHIFYEEEDGTVASCLRIFPKEDEAGTIQVGRVVTREADRGLGLGERLMREAAVEARSRYGGERMYLTGRKTALGFYQKCGYFALPEENPPEQPYYRLRCTLQ